MGVEVRHVQLPVLACTYSCSHASLRYTGIFGTRLRTPALKQRILVKESVVLLKLKSASTKMLFPCFLGFSIQGMASVKKLVTRREILWLRAGFLNDF